MLGCFCACSQKQPFPSFNKVRVHFINKNIVTTSRVNCEGFESRFPESMKVFEINSPDFVDEILNSLKEERQIPFGNGIDVRSKVFLLFNDSVVYTYCMDGTGWMVDPKKGKTVLNKTFANLIYSKIEKVQ